MIDFSGSRCALPRQLLTLAAILPLLAPVLVRADAGDTLNFSVGATLRHEDNLFRLSENRDPLATLGKPTKADDIRVTYFGVQLDKSYSLQQFHLDAAVSDYRYQTFQSLNFQARDYSALWKWHLTQRFSGNLSLDRKQTQANFADYTNYAGNNTRTTENRRFDINARLDGSWYLTGGVAQSEYRITQAFTAEDSSRQRSVDAGVRYLAESGSSITLLSRQIRGEYPDRVLNPASLLDTDFRQTDTELRMEWIASGKSALKGRLTHLDRKHENFAERDFQGTAGRIDYIMTPTGKLQLKLSAARDIASWQDANSSYYVNDSIAFAPVWQISSKTDLRFNLERSQRDYMGGAITALPVARQDQVRTAQLSLDWAPARAIALTASVQRDQRSSNVANLDYKANAVSITAQFSF
jgi:exopolysaccharide biosynthesis operon protein EpsL